MPAVVCELSSNCELEVSNLKTEGCAGVAFLGSDGTSTYKFMDNDINCPFGHGWPGFAMVGQPGDRVIMIDNTIFSPGHIAPFGCIYSENINDAVVARTTITGQGLAAIYLGTNVPFGDNQAEYWHLLGNNVEGFNALPYDGIGVPWLGISPGDLRAPIWLGQGTSNCTVVGGLGYSEYVYDEDINNDNVILELEEEELEEYIEDFLDSL